MKTMMKKLMFFDISNFVFETKLPFYEKIEEKQHPRGLPLYFTQISEIPAKVMFSLYSA